MDTTNLTKQNEDFVLIKIYSNKIKYGALIITRKNVIHVPKDELSPNENCVAIKRNLSCGDFYTNNNKVFRISVEGILAHYFVQELRISPTYRNSFITTIKSFPQTTGRTIVFKLVPTKHEIIDYAWNYRTTNLAWERLELDHALSWLSTLGGAFSALGDYFTNCALMAGKISFHQLQLALRLGDPNIAARCRLYLSLSLIQRGYLKFARDLIYKEYINAKNSIVVDTRLVKMCLGIWAKLKYEYSRQKLCI